MPYLLRKTRLAVALAAATAIGGAQALAGEPSSNPSEWVVTVTPYSWLTYLQGDVTVKGREANIYVNPIQVLEHLDTMPWMSFVEARRGRLSFYNDIVYAQLGINVTGARTFGAATLDASLGASFSETIVEVGAAYEVAKWWSGRGSLKDPHAYARFTAIDILAGARYWHQDLSISLAVTGGLDTTGLDIIGSRAVARSGSVDWVDPLIGARIRHQLAPGQELMLRGDIGGFDVGSRFSWNLVGAYSWQMAVRDGVTYSGVLGYRLLSVDYEKGSGATKYEFDVLQHGPISGLTIRF